METLNLLSNDPANFCWAGGIEDTFIPQKRPGLRPLDEYALTQHYDFWKTDFDLAAASGIRALRWGIPWFKVQPAPNRWDWSWVDDALGYLVNEKHITPILDLVHYGTPLWMDNSFLNSQYPQRVADYAAAASERYATFTNLITPLNEPTVNADMCGRKGEWPPYLVGDDGYGKVFLAIARGMVNTVRAVRQANPKAVLVQVEALWKHWTAMPDRSEQIRLGNQHAYLMFDLTTGRVDRSHPLHGFLRENGATESDIEWFQRNKIHYDVFGANFYPWSYGELTLRKDAQLARIRRRTPGGPIAEVIREAFERYGLPVMITETSSTERMGGRARWMDETIAAVYALRESGVPVVGYTWFPLITMVDWAYRRGRRPVSDYLLHLGLYESAFDDQGILQRKPTNLVERYYKYTQSNMPPLGRSLAGENIHTALRSMRINKK